MALINCPECNKQISDKAKICINCGYPIEDIMQQSANENLQTNAEKTTNGRIYKLFEANYNSFLKERNNNVDSIYMYPSLCENKRGFCEIFYLKNFVKMCV